MGRVLFKNHIFLVAGSVRCFVISNVDGVVLVLQVVKDAVPVPDHDVAANLTDMMDQLGVQLPVVLGLEVLRVEFVLVGNVRQEPVVKLGLVITEVARELALVQPV